ncbi:MAG: ABC transporter permease [Coriobacteriales bacterium]|jgi:putative ABC transport system permease protein|nr:ABC transporter permease [Coriobacteriales bacterium]
MFIRMIIKVIARQRTKMLMIALTVALGSSLASAMLNVMLDVGDKVNRELKAYGANITVQPKGALLLSDLYGLDAAAAGVDAYLPASEAAKVKTIFWAYNVVDFTPLLSLQAETPSGREVAVTGAWFSHQQSLPTGEELQSGIDNLRSWWEIEGSWLVDGEDDGVMVGVTLAEELGLEVGDQITLSGLTGATTDDPADSGTADPAPAGTGTTDPASGTTDPAVSGDAGTAGTAATTTSGEATAVSAPTSRTLTVRAIITAGGDEDNQAFVTLACAQAISGKTGLATSIEVSALTTPDNDLARRAAQNPKSLSAKDYETWYCTAYASAICYQIEEAIPGVVAKPVRQVAASEGAILEKTQLLMLFITILSMVGAGLGISNLVSASVMERSAEIGLIKALGASDAAAAWLVLLSILLTGLAGGVLGYLAGLGFAQIIGLGVFGSQIAAAPLVIPLLAVLLVLVLLLGSLPALRSLLRLRPAEVLHGR